MNRRAAGALLGLLVPLCAPVVTSVAAAPPTAATAAVPLDRVVARFSDPEAQGASSLRFVMMRELILEGWLTAYEQAPAGRPVPFDDKQLRAALERHLIEEILSERLPTTVPQSRVVEATEQARRALSVALEGRLEDVTAAAAGGAPSGGLAELETILRRRARAELYLEIAVVPPAELTEGELRAAHAKAPIPIRKLQLEEAAPLLRLRVRAERLREAAQAYYQAVRSRLRLEIVP